MRNLFKSILVVFGLFCANAVQAQTQGTLGTTSTGSNRVALKLTAANASGNQVRISGLTDVNLGTFAANHNQSVNGNSFSVCMYHNSPTFSLTISRTSNPEKGLGLMLVSTEGNTVPIAMYVNTGAGYSSNNIYSNPSDGVARLGLIGNNSGPDCAAGNKGSIGYYLGTSTSSVGIPANTLAGDYSATFQYTMAAE